MSKVSIVIITFNEEESLTQTIKAARKLSDDIIVVDSFSTDKTVDIAQYYGARVFQRKWEGYSKQKNFGNKQAKYSFVLSLDADEVVTDELQKSILNVLDNPRYDAYQFQRINIFFGKRIKHGSNKNEQVVRLFNKNKVDWKLAHVHEKLELSGVKIGKLKGELLHYTAKDIDDYISKSNNYSTLFANQQFGKNKKPNMIKIYINPVFAFMNEYFFKLGFLDGFEGYFLARQTANYTFLKYAKLKMLHKQ